MKKTTCFIAFLLCCVLLAGCTTASDVSRMIDNIGTITLDSSAAITAAEQSYNSLSTAARKRVNNYQSLLDARKRYDGMLKTNESLKTAVEQFGEITASSGSKLAALKRDYDSALLVYSPETFWPIEQDLNRMETQYTKCVLDEQFASAQTLYEQKKYDEALKELNELLDNQKAKAYHTQCKEIIDLCEEGIILDAMAQAQSLLEDKKFFEALQVLDGRTITHHKDEYLALYSSISTALQENRPKNGKVLQKTLGSGSNTFKVETKEGDDYCVKLESVSNPDKYILFYVRGGNSTTVNVPDGTYTIKYVTGENWCDLENYFYPRSSFYKCDDTTSFESNAVSYTQVVVTLYKVLNGNLSSSDISEDVF